MFNVRIATVFLVTLMTKLNMIPNMESAKENSNHWNHSHNHIQFIGTKMEGHINLAILKWLQFLEAK